MDGHRLREYWSSEVDALLAVYKQFETLVPADNHAGSTHSQEDGRYVEALVRSYLERFLPCDLEVLTGFVLRPAVLTGKRSDERAGEKDDHSSQLDVIVYNSAKYPIFQRFDRNVVVPPEGVVAVLSVKKHLYSGYVKEECATLARVSQLCSCVDAGKKAIRGPFLGLVSMYTRSVDTEAAEAELTDAYNNSPLPRFDDLIGYVGAIGEWSITKRRPPAEGQPQKALFNLLRHKKKHEHLGLQLILSGVLSVYYDSIRGQPLHRPGYTGFETGNNKDGEFLVPFDQLR